jgi:[ribosomal protein S5]-alanine N-acetyltransferase
MVETKRLLLKPLTYDQLVKYLKNDNSLEQELNLSQSSREIPAELKEALEKEILPGVADKNRNYLYATLWTIILKKHHIMIGDLCFVREPNDAGEIEIGYGTYQSFRNKGFMTEAIGGIIKWAEQQPGILSIFAATEKTNVASYSFLEKNNFTRVGETETLYTWRLGVK